MGFFDSLKSNQVGSKAYHTHVNAMQMRKAGKYMEAEAKIDEALKLYDEAYKLGFRRVNAMQGFSLLLMRRGQFERAREIMLELSKDKSLSQNDRFNLRLDFAICQWKMGKLDKAIETARNAAQMKTNGSLYTTLGMFLIEQAKQTGDFEEAIRFNQEAYEYDDEDAGTLDNLGQIQMHLAEKARKEGDAAAAAEHGAKAIEFMKKAYEIKPDQVSSAYFYAKMLNENGEKDKAREVMDKLMKLPFSAILQISKAEAEALQKEIG